MTTIRAGDSFEISSGNGTKNNDTFTILLYDKDSHLKEAYSRNEYKWLEHCQLFKYAKKYRHAKLMQVFVDSIEGNSQLCCKLIFDRLKTDKIAVPCYYHCFSCSNQTERQQSAPSKQPGQ